MKRVVLCVVSMIAASINLNAQTFDWAISNGGTFNDEGRGIVADASGNSYTTGFYRGTADFEPGTGTTNLTSIGEEDIFVQKLDPNGSLVWVKSFGGSLIDQGNAIDLDAAGNVYITGYFEGTADFDPSAGVSNLTSAGARDIFILKLNSNGDFQWVKQIGGTLLDAGNAIKIDASGNIYTSGIFFGTADLDPSAGTSSASSAGQSDIYILKLDANGDFVWVKSFGGTTYDAINAIDIDGSGNVFATGYYGTTVDFDPGAGTTSFTSEGGNDYFVLKLDANGDFSWATSHGSASNEEGFDLVVDPSNNVLMTGYYENTVDFEPGAGITNLTSSGFTDGFVHKLDNSGNLVWVKNIGGTESENPYGISTDADGNVYTAGSYSGTCDFDPNAGTTNLTPIGDYDNFVQKLTSDGDLDFAYSVGSPAGDLVFSIDVDASKNIFTTGFYRDNCEFDPGTGSFQITSAGTRDIYVHKMTQTMDDSGLESDNNIQFNLYPNPAQDNIAIITNETLTAVLIYDLYGNLVKTASTKNIAIDDLAKGVYILQINTAKGSGQQRLIKN